MVKKLLQTYFYRFLAFVFGGRLAVIRGSFYVAREIELARSQLESSASLVLVPLTTHLDWTLRVDKEILLELYQPGARTKKFLVKLCSITTNYSFTGRPKFRVKGIVRHEEESPKVEGVRTLLVNFLHKIKTKNQKASKDPFDTKIALWMQTAYERNVTGKRSVTDALNTFWDGFPPVEQLSDVETTDEEIQQALDRIKALPKELVERQK